MSKNVGLNNIINQVDLTDIKKYFIQNSWVHILFKIAPHMFLNME